MKLASYLRNSWVLKASDILHLVQAITRKNGRRYDLGLLLITCNNLVYNYDSTSEPSALLLLVAVENRYIFFTKISNVAISVRGKTYSFTRSLGKLSKNRY